MLTRLTSTRNRLLGGLPGDNLLARFVTMNLLGQGGSLAIGFVTSIVLARLLGPAGRGLLGLMLSINGLVIVVASIGLPTAVTYFASLEESDPPAILGNCLVHAGVLAAVLIPSSWFFHQQIADAVGHGAGGRTWTLVAVLVVLTFLDYTTNSQLQGTLQFARFNIIVVLTRLVYAGAVVLLLTALSLGVAGGVIATGIASLIMILAGVRPILRRGRPRVDLGLMRRMFHYGLRAEVGSILQLANGRFDVIILQIYRPLSTVGYYVVAQTIAELVLVVAQQFRWTNMVLVTKLEGDDRQAETSADAVRHYGLLAAVAAVANIVLGSAIILLAYGSQFRPAILPMLILLPGVWWMGVGIVIGGDLSGRGLPGLASTLAGVGAVVTTGLDFALIPSLGAVGAAVASVCGYSAFGLASVIALHRVGGISIRRLIVPTRQDLAAYRRFVRVLGGRLQAAFR